MYPVNTFHRAVVHYVHFQRSLRKVAAIYGCSPSTLCRWVKKQYGNTCGSIPKRTQSTVKHLHSKVSDYVCNNPFSRLSDIVAYLKGEGISTSRSSVHRILKNERFSRKRTVAKYTPKEPTTEEIQEYLAVYDSQEEIISVDESSVYLESCPLYGYSKKGTRVTKNMKRPIRGNRVTLILAISNKRGVLHHETVKGSCNSKIFAKFVSDIPVRKSARVVLDNVSFHHSRIVKEAATRNNISFTFIPPYQPDFNPVENAFSVIKSHTRRFDESIQRALSLLDFRKIDSMFQHAVKYVKERYVHA